MKESYIRIRCTEQDKLSIQMMAEQNGISMSEYILSLANEDKKHYKQVEVFGIIRGFNGTETVDIAKKSLGYALVDDCNRASVYTTYKRLMKDLSEFEDCYKKKPQRYAYLEVDGEKVENPFPMSDYVILGRKERP
jgi:hypothetical protein